MDQSPELESLAREIEERCCVMRDTLRARAAANPEELEAYWPGGAENRGDGVRAWIFCNANYTRFCDRLSGVKEERARGAEADVVAALRDAPEYAELDGESVLVYPKSFDALDFIAQRDRRIQWLVEQREKIASRAIALTPGLLDAIGNEIVFQYGLIIWASTHEGAKLPFDSRNAPDTLPDWITALSPTDYLMIYQAFVKVNTERIFVLKLMLDARLSEKQSKVSKAPSWLTFWASRAEDAGVGADVLMRDRSLPSQIAQALLAAESKLPDPSLKVA